MGAHSAREPDYAHREHFASMTELSLVTTAERSPLGAIPKAGSSARNTH
jgi:hypothetical protein